MKARALYQLKERGDTIIEVLIAILVISAVLAGAYVSANRSLNNSRQSQERAEALKLVEAQVEQVKQLANTGNAAIFTTANLFCVDVTNTAAPIKDATNPATNDPNAAFAYTADCGNKGLGSLYNLMVARSGNVFTFYARWDKAGGGGTEEIKIINRVYP